MPYFDNQTYEKQDFISEILSKGNYENCIFRLCNFAEADVKQVNFTDCRFEECNLSMVKLIDTQLNGVNFVNCKILGTKFEYCNPYLFSVHFSDCTLSMSTFFRMKLKKTIFSNCVLHEVDFTEADLQEAGFDCCDLAGTTFSFSKLQKADFRTAYNFTIDPENNQLKKSKFSKENLTGLLRKYDLDIE